MAEFYKFEIANWNEGTVNLTLEQEAAYLRVINAIRLADQPITFNIHVLCGLWRCNVKTANRLLAALVEAGKLEVRDGKVWNEKAVQDSLSLTELRHLRTQSGQKGGKKSGEVRAKLLENNNTSEALGSTREEKRREEKKDTIPDGMDGDAVDAVLPGLEPDLPGIEPDPVKAVFDAGVAILTAANHPVRQARAIVGKWRKDHPDAAVFAALSDCAVVRPTDPVGWMAKRLAAPAQPRDMWAEVEAELERRRQASADVLPFPRTADGA